MVAPNRGGDAPAHAGASPPSPAPAPSIVGRLQKGLEQLYRVKTNLDVEAFMLDDDAREAAFPAGGGGSGTHRRPREQLLVREHADELRLGLFLDRAALENLARHDPSAGLSERNFGDFCLAVEGVSHFIYVAVCAQAERPVTALELELQAEVDKFVSCLLLHDQHAAIGGELRARLYDDVSFHADLDADEHDRYVTANGQARRYAASLDRRFVRTRRTGDMLAELRRFWRLGIDAKLGHIARAAA